MQYLYVGGRSDVTSLAFSDVSLRPATNEVVTDRVDMFGMEFFAQQVTATNPAVYPYGMIQSAATTMSGVTTVADTNRPDSYYAVFDGDTASSRQCVDWFAASSADQDAMASDPANNIVIMDNGDVVQWCARQRTIAGTGNGDWFNIKYNVNVSVY